MSSFKEILHNVNETQGPWHYRSQPKVSLVPILGCRAVWNKMHSGNLWVFCSDLPQDRGHMTPDAGWIMSVARRHSAEWCITVVSRIVHPGMKGKPEHGIHQNERFESPQSSCKNSSQKSQHGRWPQYPLVLLSVSSVPQTDGKY